MTNDGPPAGQDTDGEGRRQYEERFVVRLAVRFLHARDYVLEYAENLSQGGLFVGGAQHLEPLEEVTIRLDLPGFGSYDVDCRVAHTLSEERAAKVGRTPGAGFAIMSAPPGFEKAMSEYLLVLGRRRDATVVVVGESGEALLTAAGYCVTLVTSPEEAVEATRGASPPPIAVVVPEAEAERYRQGLAVTPAAGIVVVLDAEGPSDELLNILDRRVASGKAATG